MAAAPNSEAEALSGPSGDSGAGAIASLDRLIQIVARLRHPETGCPWDLAQTPTSLIPYILEEAYEVVDAIQVGDQGAIAEELGDLLLQVVLQAQIASDRGHFDLAAVATGIADKLVRRHPHIFGDASGTTPEEVSQNWERIKAEEKGIAHQPDQLTPKLVKYSRTLPPLMAASKISVKAAQAGFEWPDIDGVWDKFHEELEEFRHALAHEPAENQQGELGDLLFTLVNLARWYGLDPSEALQGTNRRFIQRFGLLESVADKPLEDYTIDELEALWQRAKAQLAARPKTVDVPPAAL